MHDNRHTGTLVSPIATNDRTTIFYKDWGPRGAQPIVFHHGWALNGDDWDSQMLYFLGQGYRVIAHDRRGHGRSSQIGDGHDMNNCAADVAAVVTHLNLRDAVQIGHSTGGGEAAHYVARHGEGRVAKLVLIGAVPPIILKTPANQGGLSRPCPVSLCSCRSLRVPWQRRRGDDRPDPATEPRARRGCGSYRGRLRNRPPEFGSPLAVGPICRD